MAKKIKDAADAASTKYVARLDGAGVLLGFEHIPKAEVTEEHGGMPDFVDVPADCDLKPGRYRWVPAAEKFDPVPVQKVDSESAIIEGFRYLRDQHGLDIPDVTENWIAEHDKRKARAGA